LQGIALSGDPGHEGVLHFRTRSFELQFDRAAHVNVDGEVLETERCSYRVRSRALPFFCGPAPHSAARPVRNERKA
jgi:diacylglycerol kinase family enzyme